MISRRINKQHEGAKIASMNHAFGIKAMKKLLLGMAVVSLPLAAHAADLSSNNVQYNFIQDNASASARPMVMGHLELSLGWVGYYFDGNKEGDGGVFKGAGRANVPFAGNWNIELETGGNAYFYNGGGSSSNIGAYGHLWTSLNGARIGAFGGASFDLNTTTTVGVEGEIDAGSLTFGAQGSYNFGEVFCCTSGNGNFWGVRGWADAYLTPNTKLGADFSWWDGSDIIGLKIWTASGTVEHRFANTPLSGFARVIYQNNDNGPDDTLTVSGGIRIFLDKRGTTLRDHDRQVPFDFFNVPGDMLTACCGGAT